MSSSFWLRGFHKIERVTNMPEKKLEKKMKFSLAFLNGYFWLKNEFFRCKFFEKYNFS